MNQSDTGDTWRGDDVDKAFESKRSSNEIAEITQQQAVTRNASSDQI